MKWEEVSQLNREAKQIEQGLQDLVRINIMHSSQSFGVRRRTAVGSRRSEARTSEMGHDYPRVEIEVTT